MLFLNRVPLRHINCSTIMKTLRAAAVDTAQRVLETASNDISEATPDRELIRNTTVPLFQYPNHTKQHLRDPDYF